MGGGGGRETGRSPIEFQEAGSTLGNRGVATGCQHYISILFSSKTEVSQPS